MTRHDFRSQGAATSGICQVSTTVLQKYIACDCLLFYFRVLLILHCTAWGAHVCLPKKRRKYFVVLWLSMHNMESARALVSQYGAIDSTWWAFALPPRLSKNAFGRRVGKFPTDWGFWTYLQSSDKETRQFSDSFPLCSQISDSKHRVWWEKRKFKVIFLSLFEGKEGYQLENWRGNMGIFFYFAFF